jgi:hypothetical protein
LRRTERHATRLDDVVADPVEFVLASSDERGDPPPGAITAAAAFGELYVPSI